MRFTLNVEFSNLPKCLTAEIVDGVLERAVAKAANGLIAGSRKSKVTISVPTFSETADAPESPAKKKPGRKPKAVAAQAETFPVADQPDPSDQPE